MYTNSKLEVIGDNDQIVMNDITYPANYPKDEINGIYKVNLTQPHYSAEHVVTGFHIDETFTQIWDSRAKTTAELTDDLKAKALAALDVSDMVALRCFKAGIAFNTEWQAYVELLRKVVNGEASAIPTAPEYPKGS